MDGKITRDDCIELLMSKNEITSEQGRYPKKSDFSDKEVCAIKAYFGPWPRALEACGIKPVREDGKKEKILKKRIEAKRKRTELRKQNIQKVAMEEKRK